MKIVVMRRSDREKKDAVEGYGIPFRPEADDYPYGLRITLDNGSLKKLGIKDMPKPGDKFRIEGEAHVLESSQRDTEDDSDRRVELILHELGAEPLDLSVEPRGFIQCRLATLLQGVEIGAGLVRDLWHCGQIPWSQPDQRRPGDCRAELKTSAASQLPVHWAQVTIRTRI